MKQLLLSLLIVLFAVTIKASTKTNIDSLVNCKLAAIEQYHKAYADSVQRELTYYKAKEDYFSGALSDQSSRYSLIVASILALAAIVSWTRVGGIIRNQQKRMVNLSKDMDNKISDAIRNMDKISLELYQTQGRINYSILHQISVTKDWIACCNIAISSVNTSRREYEIAVKYSDTNAMSMYLNELAIRLREVHQILEDIIGAELTLDLDYWDFAYKSIQRLKEINNPSLNTLVDNCLSSMRKVKQD